MTIAEGAALAGVAAPLAASLFWLGKAWYRIQGHSDAIKGIKEHCEVFTTHCNEKQESRFGELTKMLTGMSIKLGVVERDVKWLKAKNGGEYE